MLSSLSYFRKHKPPGLEKLATPAIHEPHFEVRVSWKTVLSQRLGRSLNVVSSENRLLKTFGEHQVKRQLKHFERIRTRVSIDEQYSMCRENSNTFALKFTHS